MIFDVGDGRGRRWRNCVMMKAAEKEAEGEGGVEMACFSCNNR